MKIIPIAHCNMPSRDENPPSKSSWLLLNTESESSTLSFRDRSELSFTLDQILARPDSLFTPLSALFTQIPISINPSIAVIRKRDIVVDSLACWWCVCVCIGVCIGWGFWLVSGDGASAVDVNGECFVCCVPLAQLVLFLNLFKFNFQGSRNIAGKLLFFLKLARKLLLTLIYLKYFNNLIPNLCKFNLTYKRGAYYPNMCRCCQ